MRSLRAAHDDLTNHGYPRPPRVGDHVYSDDYPFLQVVAIPQPTPDGRAGSLPPHRLLTTRFPTIPLPDTPQRDSGVARQPDSGVARVSSGGPGPGNPSTGTGLGACLAFLRALGF